MPSPATKKPRPSIIMAKTDAERLSALAVKMEQAAPVASNMLLDEIERAEIRADGKVPGDVVRMNSTVQFVDEAHGNERTVVLVYPPEADISAGKVSVLTPVGAGLIGLRARQTIRWPDRDGHERILRILEVRPPAA